MVMPWHDPTPAGADLQSVLLLARICNPCPKGPNLAGADLQSVPKGS